MLSYQLAPTMNVLSYYPDPTANCYLPLVLEAIVCLVYQNVLQFVMTGCFDLGKC